MTESSDFPLSFDSLAVHAGVRPDPSTNARVQPIYQTTSYAFDNVDHAAALFDLQRFGHIYTRISNPTQAALEERIAALDGGSAALCTASGHAAQLLVFSNLMESGDHFVAATQLYGGSVNQFNHSFRRFGWSCSMVDGTDADAVKAAISANTKAIFVESIANPGGIVIDLERMAEIAHDAGVPLIVDNTMATPYLCRPFDWGADIIVYSTTKFMNGHGNSMGGALVESGRFDWTRNDKFPQMTTPDPSYHGLNFFETFGNIAFAIRARAVGLRDLGPAIAPLNAFLTLTGLETLPLRMQRHCDSAKTVAEYLDNHAKVAWVSHAGLANSPYRSLADKYLPKGAGSVFTFGVKGGHEAGVKIVESVRLFSHLANIGDTRSLIIHPASTTHRQLSEDQLSAAGAGPDVVRLSIGLEDPEDLIRDLEQALAKV